MSGICSPHQQFNICLYIKKTEIGIHFNLYTHAHIEKIFQMILCLWTLAALQSGHTNFNSFLFFYMYMKLNMI